MCASMSDCEVQEFCPCYLAAVLACYLSKCRCFQHLYACLQAADPLRLEAAAAAAPMLVAEIATGPYAPVGALLAGRGAGDIVHTACALAALLRPAAASPIALATA